MGWRRDSSGGRLDVNAPRDRNTILRKLRQQLHYNTVCAPDYPHEDRTSIDRESQLILGALEELGFLSNSDARQQLLNSAKRNTHAAFAQYQADKADEGRCLLESVLDDLLYYEADKLPTTSFIVDATGRARRSPTSGH
jgi:hypothetical protein